MKKVLVGLAVLVVSAVAVAVAPAAADTPGCVTKTEYRSVKKSATLAKVKRVFDTAGRRVAIATSDGYGSQIRNYRAAGFRRCRCRSPKSRVAFGGWTPSRPCGWVEPVAMGQGSLMDQRRKDTLRRTRPLVFGLALGVAALAAGLEASSAHTAVRWFHSPSRNIECQVSSAYWGQTDAYCQTWRTPRSVRLYRGGGMLVCRGFGCLSNGPKNAFTLRYGRSVRVGPFRCTSRKTGMRCVSVPSGHGFKISRERLMRF